MRNHPPLFLLTWLLSFSLLQAELRDWRNLDGTKTINAEFLNRDGSTIILRNADGRVLTLPLDKLHPEDQQYISKFHPDKPPANEPAPPQGNAFDTLEFGDDKKTVEKKLLSSSFVECNVSEELFGRTGLNGIFKTRTTIGGLHCFLYFDWTPDGALREVTLRTDPQDATQYGSKLKANWEELIELLSKLYGSPISSAPYPEKKDLQDGLMLASHLWRSDHGHSVLLGTGQENLGYSVNVRLTTKQIAPVPLVP